MGNPMEFLASHWKPPRQKRHVLLVKFWWKNAVVGIAYGLISMSDHLPHMEINFFSVMQYWQLLWAAVEPVCALSSWNLPRQGGTGERPRKLTFKYSTKWELRKRTRTLRDKQPTKSKWAILLRTMLMSCLCFRCFVSLVHTWWLVWAWWEPETYPSVKVLLHTALLLQIVGPLRFPLVNFAEFQASVKQAGTLQMATSHVSSVQGEPTSQTTAGHPVSHVATTSTLRPQGRPALLTAMSEVCHLTLWVLQLTYHATTER